MTKAPDVSIVLTTHHEGREVIPTLRSLQRCAVHAAEQGLATEIVIVQDAASTSTVETIARCMADGTLSALAVSVLPTQHADLSLARNSGIARARGEFIMIMDGDNLPSATWLADAVATARRADGPVVVHPELIVTFGERFEVWPLMASDSAAFEPGWLAWYNAWDAFCLAPREVFESFPYSPSRPGDGFGPEDWAWNCDTVAAGITHTTVPGTALFYRAHDWGSLAVLHRGSLLPTNDLMTSKSLAAGEIARLGAILDQRREEERRRELRAQEEEAERLREEAAREAARNVGLPRRAVRALRRRLVPGPQATWEPAPSETEQEAPGPLVPQFEDEAFLTEWRALHRIQPHVPHPSPATLARYRLWGTAWDDEFVTDRLAYWTGIHELPAQVDALFITPWIRTGGADLLTTQYIRAMQAQRPGVRIGLITTSEEPSTRLDDLDPDVTVSWLGRFGLTQPWSSRVLGMLISQLRPQTVHVINSYDGIEACDRYARAITAHSKVFVSTFVLDEMEDGSYWSHLHHRSRDFFDHVSGILVDSHHFADAMSYAEGIPRSTFIVHHQAVEETCPPRSVTTFGPERPARVLWAGRFDLQKRLDRLADIAERARARDLPVVFTALGEVVIGDDPATEDHLRRLEALGVEVGPPYAGGFAAVHPERFDAFLLTSDREGVPNTMLEAMASGLPVIAGDVGGISEALNDENGYLVRDWERPDSYVDALEALVDDPADALARAGRARALIESQYSFETLSATLEGIGSYLPSTRPGTGMHWYTDSGTASLLAEGHAATLVYSGANGHSNFGDILQNKNVLHYWQERGDRTPVLFVPSHAAEPATRVTELRDWFGVEHLVFFSERPWPAHAGAGLQPVAPGTGGQDFILHVVGGGYINQRWGRDHVRVIDAIAADFGPHDLLLTGLQVDAAGTALLRHLEARHPHTVFGFRDRASLDLAAQHLEGTPRYTFDDLTEVLLDWAHQARAGSSDADTPSVVLHLNTSDYAGGDEARSRWLALAAAVRRTSDAKVYLASAYADPRGEIKDTLRTIADQAEAWPFPEATIIDLAKVALEYHAGNALPALLHPLSRADFAVVSSYHTALFLALLGVPVHLVGANPYFRQKAALFGQGSIEEFLADPSAHRSDLSVDLESRRAWIRELDTRYRAT